MNIHEHYVHLDLEETSWRSWMHVVHEYSFIFTFTYSAGQNGKKNSSAWVKSRYFSVFLWKRVLNEWFCCSELHLQRRERCFRSRLGNDRMKPPKSLEISFSNQNFFEHEYMNTFMNKWIFVNIHLYSIHLVWAEEMCVHEWGCSWIFIYIPFTKDI